MNQSNSLSELVTKIFKADRPFPEPRLLVAALIAEEKQAKVSYDYSDLEGTWRLVFITGTKKARQRGGIILGAGRYLPTVIKIELSYYPDDNQTPLVENRVHLSGIELSLTGPVKFLKPKNILAFDFTRLKFKLGAIKGYDGYLPQGEAKEAKFAQERIAKQAFFRYFWISDQAIAARGRGGGLALWLKVPYH